MLCIFDNRSVDFPVNLDAFLSGLVGVFGPLVYALPLAQEFNNLHITHLKMLNVVVALKVWSNLWVNKKSKYFVTIGL